MSVVFVDGISHYTTAAQGATKYATAPRAPVAATGAFGTPGIQVGVIFESGLRYNFPASAQREFCFYSNTTTPGFADNNFVVLFDNISVQLWALLQPDGSVSIRAGTTGGYSGDTYPRPSATVLATMPANSVKFGIQQHHKIQVVHHASTGTIKWWVDGSLLVDVSGKNTASSGVAQSTRLSLGYNDSYPDQFANFIVSHVLIASATSDIVGLPRVGGLFPNGAGATSAWTPSAGANYTCVDETTPNDDTDYVSSSTVGNTDTYAMQDTPANTGTISGLAVTIRIKKDDANSRFVAGVLRIGGVDYVHATPQGVPGAYAYLQFIWSLSPATGIAFTKAEVDALEAGYTVTS